MPSLPVGILDKMTKLEEVCVVQSCALASGCSQPVSPLHDNTTAQQRSESMNDTVTTGCAASGTSAPTAGPHCRQVYSTHCRTCTPRTLRTGSGRIHRRARCCIGVCVLMESVRMSLCNCVIDRLAPRQLLFDFRCLLVTWLHRNVSGQVILCLLELGR